VHLAGNVHFGEAAVAEAGVTTGLIGLGEHVTWQARHFCVLLNLTSKITAFDRPHYFQDTMIRGAFHTMKHDHFFRALAADATHMTDVFCFSAPLGILGRLAEFVLLRRYMRALLRERNAVIRRIAESATWHQYLSPAPAQENGRHQ